MKTHQLKMTAEEARQILTAKGTRAVVMHNVRDWRREQQEAAQKERDEQLRISFTYFNPVLPKNFRLANGRISA